MPDLRSDKKASDVLELQAYFDKAIKTLALEDGSESIKSLISEQNKVIEVLNGKVKDLENISRRQNEKIDKLEDKFKGEISFFLNNIVLTDRKNDDLDLLHCAVWLSVLCASTFYDLFTLLTCVCSCKFYFLNRNK